LYIFVVVETNKYRSDTDGNRNNNFHIKLPHSDRNGRGVISCRLSGVVFLFFKRAMNKGFSKRIRKKHILSFVVVSLHFELSLSYTVKFKITQLTIYAWCINNSIGISHDTTQTYTRRSLWVYMNYMLEIETVYCTIEEMFKLLLNIIKGNNSSGYS
jgi:hypothetical protein